MKLPPRLLAEVGAALAAAGARGDVVAVRTVGGGCISPAAQLSTEDGALWFLKSAGLTTPEDFFAEEARSLRVLASTGAVRVPAVIGVSERWLLLEWLEPGSGGAAAWHALGQNVATLHRATGAEFGWPGPNYIGTLRQRNEGCADWASFWRGRRLEPQLALARRAGRLNASDERAFAALFARIHDMLAVGDVEGASLLHGDLWSGNVHMMAGGGAALVDPSCYFGHREVDLAMAHLFGGVADAFFEGYEREWPTLPGSNARLPIYQLYYLLVHVNLFGGGYAQQTRATLARALS